ncbi:hypothetical protein PHYBOEH_011962 [Phytophthora boehmeriae]|uniref:Uncharacterized protein n=1 Tax=Phytophthora boehmeriae TaxID=109152 RepID=A0A8T1VGG7_9STRA|nr:hypothetical protein PHYBOEH_011962 [Phytophthora boehmeriae]
MSTPVPRRFTPRHSTGKNRLPIEASRQYSAKPRRGDYVESFRTSHSAQDKPLPKSQQDESAEMLLLLSRTADKAAPLAVAKEPEGYTSPPTDSAQAKHVTLSPPPKATASSSEELKRLWQKEQSRVNQTNYRENGLQVPTSFGDLRLSSSLTPGQATALAMAIEAQKYVARSASSSKKTRHASPRNDIDTVPGDSMQRWREDQYAASQTVSLKRKREEDSTIAEIEALKHQIKKLQTYRAGASTRKQQQQQQQRQYNPIQPLAEFYYTLGREDAQVQFPDIRNYQQIHGCTPALQELLDLQREEFDSIASLQLHWLWYRTQFRYFQFTMTSCQRLEAGGHVIAKITGDLRLDVYGGTSQQTGRRAGFGVIVCPVQQQFEFEGGAQKVTRITSEVDLVGGIARSKARGGAGSTLRTLQCLSEGFYLSNRSNSS